MSYTYQSIDFDDVESVKFNGNDVKSIKFNGTKIWEKQQAPLFDTTFGNNSWATIAKISQQIASQNMNSSQIHTTYGWSVGDTKNITLSNNEVIQVRIIGFNHDTLSSDHTSKAGITLQMVNCLSSLFAMNNSGNAGGWYASVMRTSTLPTIKALLPGDLRSVIKLVDKKSSAGTNTGISVSQDNLFLLSEFEILGAVAYAFAGSSEGTQYAYWASHNTNADRVKYQAQSSTAWWERSSSAGYQYAFCNISNSGSPGINIANSPSGVAFAFCV